MVLRTGTSISILGIHTRFLFGYSGFFVGSMTVWWARRTFLGRFFMFFPQTNSKFLGGSRTPKFQEAACCEAEGSALQESVDIEKAWALPLDPSG